MVIERKKKQFDGSQYEILIKCSDKGDLTKWNEWRENNQTVSILLEGANFKGANLAGADLWSANLEGANFRNVNLKGAELISANLAGADLRNVNLAGADLWKTNLKGAKFIAAGVDQQTFIWGCGYDKQTVFTGKDLYLAKIEPRMKENLRINPN